MLTARGESVHRRAGLGATITSKPIPPRGLAILCARAAQASATPARLYPVSHSFSRIARGYKGRNRLKLTAKEFDLLYFFRIRDR